MTTLVIPDWPVLDDDLMSNFDHSVDQAVADRLRNEQVLAIYPGWDFNATCWFADGMFHAGVHVFHEYIETLSAGTPEELMTLVCEEYGEK